jgi:hypothetical protein
LKEDCIKKKIRRNKKTKTSGWNDKQQNKHQYFFEIRESNMRFEKEKYDYEKKLGKERLEIEQQRMTIESEWSLLE